MQIKVTIDRFENGSVVLKTDDKQTIVWPKNKLPENIHEGSVLTIAVNSDIDSEKNNRDLAKDILNEILDSSEEE